MKNIIFLAFAVLFAASCSTIEDRDELFNSYDKDDIRLSVEQQSPGSNVMTLKLNTKGVVGYWDYLVGSSYTDAAEVIFPYVGTHTFKFQTTTPYFDGDLSNLIYPSETIEVEVTSIDAEPDAKFKVLTGDDFMGKEWVFDGTLGDGGVWWAMTDPANPSSVWWNAAGLNQGSPTDLNGKMSFDFDGGANYTYWTDASDESTKIVGTFALGNNFTQISFPNSGSGANLMGANSNAVGPSSFQILEISPDKMKLWAVVDGGTGWVWQFKPVN